jgi:1,2-diacylglycerol 3-beta-glucosyltransferase
MSGRTCRPRRAGTVIAGVTSVVALVPAAFSGYLAILTAAAWRARLAPAVRPPARPPSTRFAVLIPAHDEAQLIASAVRSVAAASYPGESIAVHVAADHCTDRTAEIARAHGAEVHGHDDPEPAGKGPALTWLLRRLVARGDSFDVVVVIDADSVVDHDFFVALDDEFATGAAVVQARYTVRDAPASPATALRSAALDLRHHVRPLGRTALGASCGLYGNGMAFRTDVLVERAWAGHLTEDLELQIRLVLDGIDVRYAPRAIVAAEMPVTLDDAASQNERWERGRLELARRAPGLVARALRTPGRRVALVDTAIDVAVPPLSVLVAATGGAAVACTALRVAHPTAFTRRAAVLSALGVVALAGHVLVGLRIAGAPRSAYRALSTAPLAIAWKVRLWARTLAGGSDVEWTRTARNREAVA